MHISCPHCNAAYNVGTIIKNAVLVCHRCHAEFNMGDEAKKQQEHGDSESHDSPLPLFEHQRTGQTDTDVIEPVEERSKSTDKKEALNSAQSIPVPAFLAGENEYANEVKEFIDPVPQRAKKNHRKGGEKAPEDREALPLNPINSETTDKPIEESADIELDEIVATSEPAEPVLPARKELTIWPWLVAIMLMISAVGFWYKQDVWLEHPWVRSMLINLHLPVAVRDKDWLIVPESVQGNWLKRDDGSQVLIIQGRIENRLYCELSPPKILVRFFDESGITDSLEERVMPITEPPSMEKVKHAPFVVPDLDRVAVEAQGQRGFFIVLESLPEQAADFTLNPVVH